MQVNDLEKEGSGSGSGLVEVEVEDVLKEKGSESVPFGGKRLVTETNGERIESFVQRLVASRNTSLPPSPCKNLDMSPLASPPPLN